LGLESNSEASARLAQLLPAAHAGWRCLRVVAEFKHFPHAARRLHVGQGALRTQLLDLSQHLGVEHLRLDGDSIHLSAALRQMLRGAPPPMAGTSS
jgi:DNA-binding transcriptional LysR family regulator